MRSLHSQGRALPLLLILSVVAALGVPARAQRGAMSVAMNLEQLVGEADTIVEGYVRSWRAEPHPDFENLDSLVIEIAVTDSFKGNADKTFTFRQYIWDVRDLHDGAGYRKGQHILLMVGPESHIGFSSPVGLSQGRFRVIRDAEGREYAVNGSGNSTLFRNLSAKATRALEKEPLFVRILETGQAGPIELDALQDMVRALTGVQQ